jgi:hypothetical protein
VRKKGRVKEGLNSVARSMCVEDFYCIHSLARTHSPTHTLGICCVLYLNITEIGLFVLFEMKNKGKTESIHQKNFTVFIL